MSQYDQEEKRKEAKGAEEVVVKSESEIDVDDMDMTMELKGSNVFFGFKNQLKRYREIVNIIGEYLADQLGKSTFKGDRGGPGEEGAAGKF